MFKAMRRGWVRPALLGLALLTMACEKPKSPPAKVEPPGSTEGKPSDSAAKSANAPAAAAQGRLVLAYAQFLMEGGKVTAKPGPARVEILSQEDGEWKVEAFEDETSNVFHKAMGYAPASGEPGILTLGGMKAAVKLWRKSKAGAFSSVTLWEEAFGGKFDRMRDAEIAGKQIFVGTHDQGVVAVLSPEGTGMNVQRIDEKKDTFIHEIETGDLNKDGKLEVYATPSEPNKIEGGAQPGEVVRYVPGQENSRKVVAKLGYRHAKEILVDDVDGDGTDELYVVVEALTRGSGGAQVVEPVEIRRYDADTPADKGVVIARIPDRFCRFLTAGDVDGDGKKEMVAAAFKSGLWLVRPGKDARAEWAVESIDRDSGGFEHAALLTDLDRDGVDELYVAADEQGELRQYRWKRKRPRLEVIQRREHPQARMTWNITALYDSKER